MNFEIRNRWTCNAQVVSEIECKATASDETKLGLAVRWAIKNGADLCGANLSDADLCGANLCGANLSDADLCDADLSGANLIDADLSDADLLCMGNMREIKTMQIDTWAIGYTHDTLQIGCHRHEIEKWRKWDTDAGRKWIAQMDSKARQWADRNMSLVLKMIDASPATPPKAAP